MISEHLVTFATVKELEQKNKHLLALTRDLSSQLEEQELKVQRSHAALPMAVMLFPPGLVIELVVRTVPDKK